MPKVSLQHEQARREQIVAAAAACFSKSGFAATSVPAIVAEAGLSVGSIYRYFSSKEDLFLAVVEDRVAVYDEAVFAELDQPGPAIPRLRAAIQRLQALLQAQQPEDARLSLELWARAHDVEELGRWLREARWRRYEALRQVIRQGRLAGEVRRELNPDDAASALIALADGLVVRRACAPFVAVAGDPVSLSEALLRTWDAGREER